MSRMDFSDREWERLEKEAAEDRSRMGENVADATARIRERSAEAARTAGEKVREGGENVAGTIHRTASRVREAGQRTSSPTMGKLAERTASGLERGAGYLREGGLQDIRNDVENIVRDRPAESIIAALAAGFVLGRLLRRT